MNYNFKLKISKKALKTKQYIIILVNDISMKVLSQRGNIVGRLLVERIR